MRDKAPMSELQIKPLYLFFSLFVTTHLAIHPIVSSPTPTHGRLLQCLGLKQDSTSLQFVSVHAHTHGHDADASSLDLHVLVGGSRRTQRGTT